MQRANYNGYGNRDGGRNMTVLVDTFLPNPWGLFQVHGNVNDWLEDCVLVLNIIGDRNYEGAPTNGSAFTGGDCSNRNLRGGSYWMGHTGLRSAQRGSRYEKIRSSDTGFRVARSFHED
jgi:formylglycine-generating enzyme required for sulfatase activity